MPSFWNNCAKLHLQLIGGFSKNGTKLFFLTTVLHLKIVTRSFLTLQPSVWRYPSETCDKKPSHSGFRIVNLKNCTDGDIRTNIKSATFYTVPHSLSRLCEIASDFPLERNIINDVIIMKEKRLQMKKKKEEETAWNEKKKRKKFERV